MDEMAGSENPLQKLYTNLLLHNLDVVSSSLSHLFMMGEVWTTIGRDLRLRVLGEEELYTHLGHKANTSKEVNMPVEYEAKEEKPKPIEFDAEEADLLLDVVIKTHDMPNLANLNKAAMTNLVLMAAEIEEQFKAAAEKAKEAADKAAADAAAKKKAKDQETEDESR